MQKYLQYALLLEKELLHFDAWASTFGETVIRGFQHDVVVVGFGDGEIEHIRRLDVRHFLEHRHQFRDFDFFTCSKLNAQASKPGFHCRKPTIF